MKLRALWLPGSLALLLSANVFATTTWTVTSTGDASGTCGSSCTLRAAIESAGDGDTIQFDGSIDGGTILLGNYSNVQTGPEFGPSAFFITGNKSIVIDGMAGLTRGITIARDTAKAPFRLFDVDVGSGLALVGLTLKNGLAQGFSSGSGGGALGAGGAIFNQGSVTIDSCTFAGNIAQGGRSGDGSGTYSGAGVGSAPTNGNGGGPNGATTLGGAGRFGGGGSAYDQGGGGGFGGGGGSGGSGGAGGFGAGAGGNSGGGPASGGFGGGGNNDTSSGGGGAGMGGAIFNDAGSLSIVNSTFTGNSASGGAGGNAAAGGSGFGGAIFSYSATLAIVSSTLAHNGVAAASGGTADGGALYSLDDRDCGAGGNTCANGSASNFDLEHSIFANSSAAHDVVVNGHTQSGSDTFSGLIVMSYDNTQFTISNFIGSNDPQLGPLGDHGGWTPTVVPKQGSAAIDALTCSSGFVHEDQRGVLRPQGAQCDIGAVEYDGDYIFANGFDY